MNSKLFGMLIAFGAMAWVPPTAAVPVPVGIGAFGGATLIDFNSLANNTLITNQFVASGVVASGGLFADTTNSGAIFGSPAASNFLPTSPGPGPYNTITLTFSSAIIRIGMNEISNSGTFNIAEVGGTLGFASSLTPSFVGLEDLNGFTSVVLTVTGAANNAFGIDNLRFTPRAVPEPASLALIALGLAGFGLRRRKLP